MGGRSDVSDVDGSLYNARFGKPVSISYCRQPAAVEEEADNGRGWLIVSDEMFGTVRKIDLKTCTL